MSTCNWCDGTTVAPHCCKVLGFQIQRAFQTLFLSNLGYSVPRIPQLSLISQGGNTKLYGSVISTSPNVYADSHPSLHSVNLQHFKVVFESVVKVHANARRLSCAAVHLWQQLLKRCECALP